MAFLYKADGTIEKIKISQHSQLKSMQNAVGGYIELVASPDEERTHHSSHNY